MPPRTSTPSTPMARAATDSPGPRNGWAPRLLQAGLLGLGALIGGGLLGLVWPRMDLGSADAERQLGDLANPPNRSVTVLLIGLDSDRIGDPSNQAAPPGPANADALVLLRVNPGGPLQVLSVPPSLAVQLPNQPRPQPLGSLFRIGGAALTAGVVRELVELPTPQPDRYVVMGRGALRALVDGLGSVEANPRRTMQYRDEAQNLSIDLQSGLQRLNGSQLEQLARWRDPNRPVSSRLDNHQEVMRSLHQELTVSQRQLSIADLVNDLLPLVRSNLSTSEMLSLLLVALQPGSSIQFTNLPLEPPRPSPVIKASGLRERAFTLPLDFWSQPRGNRAESAP